MHTIYCIRCLKKLAKFWCGHVIIIDKNGKIKTHLAGWCSQRCFNVQGFRGHFLDKMGLK